MENTEVAAGELPVLPEGDTTKPDANAGDGSTEVVSTKNKVGDEVKVDDSKSSEQVMSSVIENHVNNAFGKSDRLPPGLGLGGRNNSFFETKLDIAREMEERNKREFDVWGKETYLNATKQNNLIPMTIALRQLPTEELNLSHRVMDSHDLKPLCLSLHTNANIYSLVLDDNAIGIDGAKWLLTALKENVAVRELSLADNHLGNSVCGLIAELLALNRNIVSVNLAGNSLDDRAGRDIGAILEVTFTLKTFNLARNKLSDGAAEEIANSLRYNDSIEWFSLEWNNFMPQGCKLIFNGLKKNLGVRFFRFIANGTDDACVTNIAEMLQSNHVMQSLDISSSRISDRGIPMLISGLIKNDALEQINLNGNLLSEPSVFLFIDFVRTCSTCAPMKKIILQTTPIRYRAAEMIIEFQKDNPDGPVILAGPVVIGYPGRKPGPPTPREPEPPKPPEKDANAEDQPKVKTEKSNTTIDGPAKENSETNNNPAPPPEQPQEAPTTPAPVEAAPSIEQGSSRSTPAPCSRQSTQIS